MSNFIDKTRIPVAVTDNTKLDLSHQHITTANWMQINPVLCKEMVPGESCDVNLLTFSKMQPLAVPTFGRANIKERAFFVPMRTIWRAWTDFITDTSHIYSGAGKEDTDFISVLTRVPVVSNQTLLGSFTSQMSFPTPGGNTDNVAFVDVISNPTDDSAYDIRGVQDNGTVIYYRLTSYGRQWLKILDSLGYKFVWDPRNTDQYSALPIMAMVKIILDWYYPSQYANTGDYIELMGYLNNDGATIVDLGVQLLVKIARVLLYANYDSDYFTSAWDTPTSPSAGVYSNFSFVDITNNATTGKELVTNAASLAVSPSQAGYKPTNGTPFVGGSASSNATVVGVFTQYTDTALHLLTDYMKRHQLAGARAMDRYLARFGKQLSVEKLNRCNYIGSKMVPLQIGEVMSTTSMGTLPDQDDLGKFGGKGMAMEKNFSFNWSTDEYGYLIVLSTIIPSAKVWQGLDRKIMHISKTDFFTPEFDNLGVQAISTRELYNDLKGSTYLSTSANGYCGFNGNVFGFAPRYGEYKYANDQLTGDFVCSTLNNGTNANESAWHLMRTFAYTDFYNGSSYNFTYLVHSRNFVSGLNDHFQYNRIFTYMSDDERYQPDPFTFIYDFQMVSQAPMKALYENYDWCDADEGHKVTEENNGVKLN